VTIETAAQLRAGSAWALASVGVALSVAVVRTVIVARLLGPADIGLMAIGLLAIGFVEAVASSGVDTALVAQRDDIRDYLGAAFVIQATRGVLVLALLYALAPLLAHGFHNPAALDVIRAVALLAVLRGIANPAVAVAVRRMDFHRLFWWSLPEPLASLVFTTALAVHRRDVWALVFGTLAAQAVGTLASYGVVRSVSRPSLDLLRIRSLLRFGRFVSWSRALMYFSVNLDSVAVGLTTSTHVLGLYQFATRVAEIPVVTFTRAVAQVALPALSGRRDPASLAPVWRSLRRSVLTANAAVTAAMLVFAPAIVSAATGDRWMAAVPALRILSAAMFCRALIVITGQLLDAVGRPQQTLQLNAVRLALLAASVPIALTSGIEGVALAVLGANALAAVVGLRLASGTLSG
jgi:lipopolysaccharide exporter